MNGLPYVGDGRWVAVGLLGKAACSTDGGRTWTVSHTSTRKTLEAVATDGANVVSVGWDGAVAHTIGVMGKLGCQVRQNRQPLDH